VRHARVGKLRIMGLDERATGTGLAGLFGMVKGETWQRLYHVLPWAILAVLLLAGAVLRFYRLADLFIFLPDQGQEANITWTMIQTRTPALIGIKSSVGIYHGPAYNYLLLIPFLIGGGHPVSGAALSGVFDLLAMVLLFIIGRRLFSVWAGLVAAALWCSATMTVYFARFGSDYCPLPFFVLLMFYGLLQIIEGRERWLLLVVPLLSVAWQLHDQAVLLAPFYGLVWLWFRPRIRLRTYAFAFLLTMVTLAPYLVYELRNDFFNFRSIVRYVFQSRGSGDGSGGLGRSAGRVQRVLQVLDERLLPAGVPWHLLAQMLLAVGLIGLILALRGDRRREIQLFLLWLLTPLAYVIWPGPLDLHYLIILFPLPFLLLGFGVDTLRRAHWGLALPVAIGIGWLVLTGTQMTLGQFRASMPGTYPTTIGVVDHVIASANDQPFAVRLVSRWEGFDQHDSPYRYLFAWRGAQPSARADIQTFVIYDHQNLRDGPTQPGVVINDVKVVHLPAPVLGRNVLLNPDFSAPSGGPVERWQLPDGAARIERDASGTALVLTGTEVGDRVSAVQDLSIEPGKRYIIRFGYRNRLDAGAQHVYFQVKNRAGATLDIFPNGGGYVAAASTEWDEGSFLVEVPPGGEVATLWLRNRGIGDAWFRNVEVREVLP
jgi:4-amino-4-deoxy-L-arabinose transferase-like glycosyltransferase